MARLRALALAGLASGAVGVLVLASSCADPTQIVLEVFTDACPGSGHAESIQSTGIAVGTAADIEARRPASFKDGCETATGIGTLTIYPSGDKDAEVAIKVLGGVEVAPDRCDPPSYAGCIVHRRMLRFVPHVSQRVTVRLTLACLNRECPSGTTCEDGTCVGAGDVLDDGGTSDAPRFEAGVVPSPFFDAGPTPDGAVDPCTGCRGTCAAGVCTVDCSKVDCNAAGSVCAPTLPCDVACPTGGACKSVTCTTSASCRIRCSGAASACTSLACNAETCDVTCDGNDSCNASGTLALKGTKSASLDCDGDRACRTATLSCASDSCVLHCDPSSGGNAACPTNKGTCTSGLANGCEKWK
ncbi:MAG: repeat domain protein [Labilithrix sp.]|nr:repeat domain protein [Labilithrix sp.]